MNSQQKRTGKVVARGFWSSLGAIPLAFIQASSVVYTLITANVVFLIITLLGLIIGFLLIVNVRFVSIFTVQTTQSIIELSKISIDARNFLKPLLEFIPGIYNPAGETVRELSRAFIFDELCDNKGLSLGCLPGIEQFKKIVFLLFNFAILLQETILKFFEVIALSIREFACKLDKFFIPGQDAEYCSAQTTLPFLSAEEGMTVTEFSRHQIYQILNINITTTTNFYIDQLGFTPIIKVVAGVIADIIDIFFNIVIEYLILILLFLLAISIVFIKYSLLLIAIFVDMIGGTVLSIFYFIHSAINPVGALQKINNGTRDDYTGYIETGLGATITDFVLGIDPDELFLTNSTFGIAPPGPKSVREVLRDIVNWIDDTAAQIFLNLPFVVIFLDKLKCFIENLSDCAVDFEICHILFDDSGGFIGPLLQQFSGLTNFVLGFVTFVNNTLNNLENIFNFTQFVFHSGFNIFAGTFNFINDFAFPLTLIPDIPTTPAVFVVLNNFNELDIPPNVESACDLFFSSAAGSCPCSACAINATEAAAVAAFLGPFGNALLSGAPCLPQLEERCCLIASPNFIIYNQQCEALGNSVYTSIFFYFSAVDFDILLNNPFTPTRCVLFGSTFVSIGRMVENPGFLNHWDWNQVEQDVTHLPGNEVRDASYPYSVEAVAGTLIDPFTRTFSLGILSNVNVLFVPPFLCTTQGYAFSGADFVDHLVDHDLPWPIDGCVFANYLIGPCYARFKSPVPFVLDSVGKLMRYGNLFCSSGLPTAKAIQSGDSPIVYRPTLMCRMIERWVNEHRKFYLRRQIRNWIINNTITNSLVIDSIWTSDNEFSNVIARELPPYYYVPSPQLVIFFITSNQTDFMCDSLFTKFSDCKIVFTNLKDFVNYESAEDFTIPEDYPVCDVDHFPIPPVGIERYRMRLFLNHAYWEYAPGIRNEYFANFLSNAQFIRTVRPPFAQPLPIEFCLSFINRTSTARYFGCLINKTIPDPGNCPQVDMFREKLYGDPATRPIHLSTQDWLLNTGEEFIYAHHPETFGFPCVASGTENAADYVDNDQITQYYLAVEHYMYSDDLMGKIIIQFFNASFINATTGGNGTLCGFISGVPGLESIFDCDNTAFYVPDNWEIFIANWQDDVKFFFLKTFFRDIITNYTDEGESGSQLDLANRMSFTPLEIEEESIANMLRKIVFQFTNQDFLVDIIKPIFLTTSINYTTIMEDCELYKNNIPFCSAYGHALQNNGPFLDCILNPFVFLPLDPVKECIKVWIDEFWTDSEGARVKAQVDRYVHPTAPAA